MTTPVCTSASDAAVSAGQTRPYPSFASYVRARQPVLLRTARSLTANPSDAEDLLQTALARTYVAWERIEDHRALDALRAKVRPGFDASPYQDEVGFTRNLEGVFRQMFERWLAKA